MPVNPVSGASGATMNALTGQSEPAQNTLGKDAFMELLVASLKYQDPSEPMSTSELMAQTTQLTTMEQLTELTELSQQSFALQMRTSATNLVGQQVAYYDGEDTLSGVVQAVDFSSSVPAVVVDDENVALDAIAAVSPPPNDDDA